MARNTRQHVFEGMELLPEGLIPFVEKRLDSQIKGHWQVQVSERVRGLRAGSDGQVNWDQQGLLWAMMIFWKEAFSTVLGHSERSYVSELLGVRNKLSHNGTFTDDDAERALDTMWRLLEAVSAREVAEKIRAARETMLRTRYAEPHQDVATGDFQPHQDRPGSPFLLPFPWSIWNPVRPLQRKRALLRSGRAGGNSFATWTSAGTATPCPFSSMRRMETAPPGSPRRCHGSAGISAERKRTLAGTGSG